MSYSTNYTGSEYYATSKTIVERVAHVSVTALCGIGLLVNFVAAAIFARHKIAPPLANAILLNQVRKERLQ